MKQLVVRAGARARARLEAEGFHAALFDTLVGASGGPKWLVLRALDEVLCERLVRDRATPLDTLGSSIGSFRHACLAQRDPRAALARFTEAYVEQAYDDGFPTPAAISKESDRILLHLLGDGGASEIVSNPRIRSHFVAARLRRDRGLDAGYRFRLQLGAGAAWNALSRRALGRAFERIVFAPAAPTGPATSLRPDVADASRPSRTDDATLVFRDLPTRPVLLTASNLRPALLASGSIPLVMAGVRGIPGVEGPLFDGGLVDYHFDFAWTRRPGLVLFPHFFDRITPGWFDQWLPWRGPRARDLDDVVLIAPSAEFVRALPGGRVPDRHDFLSHPTAERIRRWRSVLDASRRLADEFEDLVASGRLVERLEPFPARG